MPGIFKSNWAGLLKAHETRSKLYVLIHRILWMKIGSNSSNKYRVEDEYATVSNYYLIRLAAWPTESTSTANNSNHLFHSTIWLALISLSFHGHRSGSSWSFFSSTFQTKRLFRPLLYDGRKWTLINDKKIFIHKQQKLSMEMEKTTSFVLGILIFIFVLFVFEFKYEIRDIIEFWYRLTNNRGSFNEIFSSIPSSSGSYYLGFRYRLNILGK